MQLSKWQSVIQDIISLVYLKKMKDAMAEVMDTDTNLQN
jgi:hypothetical protein